MTGVWTQDSCYRELTALQISSSSIDLGVCAQPTHLDPCDWEQILLCDRFAYVYFDMYSNSV